MRCRAVVTVLVCVLLGGVVQALVACVLALRSPLGGPAPSLNPVVWQSRAAGGPYLRVGGSRADTSIGREDIEGPARRAAFEMWPRLRPGVVADTYQEFGIQVWEGFGVAFAAGYFVTDPAMGWRSPGFAPSWEHRYRAGWPMLSMAATHDNSGAVRGGVRLSRRWMARDRNRIVLVGMQQPVRAILPLRPQPLGTAINSLVFGAPFLLVAFARWARRRRRDRDGRCLRCGYNRAGLAGSAPCPECGHPSAGGSHRESSGGVGAAAPASAGLERVAGPDKGVEEQGAPASAEK